MHCLNRSTQQFFDLFFFFFSLHYYFFFSLLFQMDCESVRETHGTRKMEETRKKTHYERNTLRYSNIFCSNYNIICILLLICCEEKSSRFPIPDYELWVACVLCMCVWIDDISIPMVIIICHPNKWAIQSHLTRSTSVVGIYF